MIPHLGLIALIPLLGAVAALGILGSSCLDAHDRPSGPLHKEEWGGREGRLAIHDRPRED